MSEVCFRIERFIVDGVLSGTWQLDDPGLIYSEQWSRYIDDELASRYLAEQQETNTENNLVDKPMVSEVSAADESLPSDDAESVNQQALGVSSITAVNASPKARILPQAFIQAEVVEQPLSSCNQQLLSRNQSEVEVNLFVWCSCTHRPADLWFHADSVQTVRLLSTDLRPMQIL